MNSEIAAGDVGIIPHQAASKCKNFIRFEIIILTLSSLTVMMISMEKIIMTLDPEQLRHAMRAWTTGVAVVTAQHDTLTVASRRITQSLENLRRCVIFTKY